MSILGNPITLGGGGADLNIDFGSTPPADTSKLWVPLAKKPNKTSIISYFDGQTGNLQSIGSFSPESGAGYGSLTPRMVGDELWVVRVNTFSSSVERTVIAKFNLKTKQFVETLTAYNIGYMGCGIVKVGDKIYSLNTRYSSGGYAYTEDKMCIIDPTTGRYSRTSLSILGITQYAYTSAVTDGKYIYALGGSSSDNNSVDKIFVIDPELLKITKTFNFGVSLYNASSIIYYNGFAYFAYNNTPTVAQCKTCIKRINLTTFEHSDIYQNGTDMLSSYLWSLTNDGETAFLAWANWGNASSSTNYSSKTLRFNLLDTNINPVVVSEQKPGNYGGRLFQEAYLGNIYSCLNDTLYTIPYKRDLASGDLAITADVSRDGIDILADKNNSIFINPISVYLGDENSVAQKVDAYLYDNADGKWKTLDGVSYTADMLNALNIMGVN
nr:MAG TPA: Influenza virus NS1A-binding protein export, mRNA splicing, SPLICING.6A [Caudoviricetes sp.]